MTEESEQQNKQRTLKNDIDDFIQIRTVARTSDYIFARGDDVEISDLVFSGEGFDIYAEEPSGKKRGVRMLIRIKYALLTRLVDIITSSAEPPVDGTDDDDEL